MKRALALVALITTPALAEPYAPEPVRIQIAAAVRAGRQDCSACDLFQADLSYLDIRGRNFSGTRLRQADLELAEADRANFAHADMSVLNGFGARFTGANFAGANLADANLVGAYFAGANFTGARLDRAVLAGAELAGARGLTQAQISLACGDRATTLPTGMTIRSC